MTDKHKEHHVQFAGKKAGDWERATRSAWAKIRREPVPGIDPVWLRRVGRWVMSSVLSERRSSVFRTVEDIARVTDEELDRGIFRIGPESIPYINVILDEILSQSDRPEK